MNALIIIIANPASRNISASKIKKAAALFDQKGFATRIIFTERQGHAAELARDAVLLKPFRILAAGGDGTINEVINGMAHSDVPLGILPFGTTNVLAKELSIPRDIEQAASIVLTAAPRLVSLGKIEYTLAESTAARYFCLMAGIGFDGQAVLGADPGIKRFSGKGAYIYSALQNLVAYHPNELFFSVDGTEVSGYWAIICKASKYGGNFRVAPDARLTEPTLYACIFRGSRRRDLLRYTLGIVRGTHLKDRDIFYQEVSHIEVLGSAHVQVDGDYAGVTPAKLSVEKDALTIAGLFRQ